ncbi:hypothetical protein [Sorangium cellulosum]|uniref:Uncharacterized protein n=1 Tax=Sorangium cellulosum TaxID=56 RepID=A0A150QPI1_SORCE|nr:hypothetical protein [Sorangium cellulosum]KYF69891.1 hypothetical protein BE15_39740 [Sorangium cellulosum]
MEGFLGFSRPLWEIALRTTLVYLALVIGITDITTVRSACLEADGEISVVKEQGAQGGEP